MLPRVEFLCRRTGYYFLFLLQVLALFTCVQRNFKTYKFCLIVTWGTAAVTASSLLLWVRQEQGGNLSPMSHFSFAGVWPYGATWQITRRS